MGALTDLRSWTMFVLVWVLAIAGATLKVLDMVSKLWLSTGLYIVLGWLVLIATVPLVEGLPMQVDIWLVAGGIAYSAGVIFFMLDARLRYAHTVWHCFVILGT